MKDFIFNLIGWLIGKVPRPVKVIGDYGPYTVVQDAVVCWEYGMVGRPGAAAYQNKRDGKYYIAVNKRMLKAGATLMTAAMAHEAAHIKAGHVGHLHQSIAMEIEADSVAYRELGVSYLLSLREMYECYPEDDDLRRRIGVINSLEWEQMRPRREHELGRTCPVDGRHEIN